LAFHGFFSSPNTPELQIKSNRIIITKATLDQKMNTSVKKLLQLKLFYDYKKAAVDY